MVAAEDFAHYDLILAMDEENLLELRRRAPAIHHERIRLMMEFAPAQCQLALCARSVLRRRAGIRGSAGLVGRSVRGLVAELRKRPAR